MLNLTSVRAFVTVVETASFRQAAHRLGTAQPTVSQQIRKLEEDLGTVLVQRGRKACRPTRLGEAFLPQARALIRAAERASNVVSQHPIRVGASGNVGTYLLPGAVKAFTNQLRDPAAIDLALAPNPETAIRLENGEIDVAVMEWWDGRTGFEPALWRREPMRVIMPPDHPWVGVEAIPREWLPGEAMIGGETGTGTGRLLADLMGDDIALLQTRFRLDGTEAVKMAVRHGLGISVVLASAVTSEVASGHLVARPIAGAELRKEIFCVTPANLPMSSGARKFRDLLINRGSAFLHGAP
jgi:DNA-binding transcriptional LysR family regulator